jgi:hypothetical protein
MLMKGSSIARLCDEFPSYREANQKTIYGKKHAFQPTAPGGKVTFNRQNFDLDATSEQGETNIFTRRNSSMNNTTKLRTGTSDLDVGMMSISGDEKKRIKKIPTKFPPPPYLPGEV